MADNEAVDVNIAGSVNGDSSEFDNIAAKKTESKDLSGADDHLKARIEELEREKRELKRENDEMKEAVEQMAEEKEKRLGEMKTAEEERDDMERKAMESITKRAFELEGEVLRLQHDLGTALNSGDESNREVERLTREIGDLTREKASLSEKLSAQAEELERSESDSRSKIGELEKKIEDLEESERVVRREASVAKARLNELESEIAQLKKEKTEVDEALANIEAELKNSVMKVDQIIEGEENSREPEEIGERDAGFRGLRKKVTWPVAGAVSAGVVVAALAVCCVRFNKAG